METFGLVLLGATAVVFLVGIVYLVLLAQEFDGH